MSLIYIFIFFVDISDYSSNCKFRERGKRIHIMQGAEREKPLHMGIPKGEAELGFSTFYPNKFSRNSKMKLLMSGYTAGLAGVRPKHKDCPGYRSARAA